MVVVNWASTLFGLTEVGEESLCCCCCCCCCSFLTGESTGGDFGVDPSQATAKALQRSRGTCQ